MESNYIKILVSVLVRFLSLKCLRKRTHGGKFHPHSFSPPLLGGLMELSGSHHSSGSKEGCLCCTAFSSFPFCVWVPCPWNGVAYIWAHLPLSYSSLETYRHTQKSLTDLLIKLMLNRLPEFLGHASNSSSSSESLGVSWLLCRTA